MGDTTTFSTATYGQSGTKITIFHSFAAAGQTYTALALKLLYSATAGTDDNYIVDYSTSGATDCSDYKARTWTNLVPASHAAATLVIASTVLPPGQNLTQLCVKYYSTKTGSPDGATFNIYDIWTEGTYTVNTAPNAPTLVSPDSGSTTNDNTPTLSANYSDPDAADTGTTNYRISLSSLADCNNNVNVVASGTSSETSSNNQNTIWTPGSSIGSDATYYWCAQNNDGALTSSWTSMGNFILDTAGPTLSFSDNVAVGPVISDTIIGSWGDATVKKWDYDADGNCPTTVGDYTKTDANSTNQTTEANNTKYICLYGEDALGNKTTLASANDINIDTAAPTITITAPTKLSNSTITNTTINVTDNNAITAVDVTVDALTTAGYSNFNCTQTDSKTVDCTIDIVSSGNLTIKAIDNATNQSTQSESGYTINSIAPSIAITAPTKISNANITNTTINVTDSDGIQAANVTIDASMTAGYFGFNCAQTDANTVDCTITINSSGNLVVKAIDDLANSVTQAENNYIIDTASPVITITAPTKILNASIADTTIHVTDDIGIPSANVLVDNSTTVGTSHLVCVQTNSKTVDCAIHIDSSGNLIIHATDNVANTATQTENGYSIDSALPTVPGIPRAIIGTNLISQVWTWTASTDAGSGVKQYDWWVDGGPSGISTLPTVNTNLTEGNWKFHVKAEDNYGNQSAESSAVLIVLASSVYQATVDCSVPLVQVVTANDISNPNLDLTPITVSSENLLVANVNCEINLKTPLPLGSIIINIPAGAEIKGLPNIWTKVIIPPITTTPTLNLLPAPSPGFSNQVALAVLIGHNVATLDITRGVRIFLEGQAGKKIGYISNNVFTEITNTCANDSQAVGDALGTKQDCKIDSGSDLVFWTKHFTEFVTYTVVAASNAPSAGENPPLAEGGGGMPPEWNNPPKPPAGGFGVSINNGAEYTASPTVILSLKGGSDTTKMVISNFPDFKDASQENYATTKIWNLCWKNAILQTPSDCPAGTYTVYAKYYTSWGTASNVVSDTIVIKKLDQTGQGLSLIQPFTKNLKLGQALADVKRLQIFLNQNSDTQIAKSGVGSPGKETTFFGSLTKTAVIKFQEKYASEILAPLGLKKGTGICAEYTRAKINKLLGF